MKSGDNPNLKREMKTKPDSRSVFPRITERDELRGALEVAEADRDNFSDLLSRIKLVLGIDLSNHDPEGIVEFCRGLVSRLSAIDSERDKDREEWTDLMQENVSLRATIAQQKEEMERLKQRLEIGTVIDSNGTAAPYMGRTAKEWFEVDSEIMRLREASAEHAKEREGFHESIALAQSQADMSREAHNEAKETIATLKRQLEESQAALRAASECRFLYAESMDFDDAIKAQVDAAILPLPTPPAEQKEDNLPVRLSS